jgi:hypothetical protein
VAWVLMKARACYALAFIVYGPLNGLNAGDWNPVNKSDVKQLIKKLIVFKKVRTKKWK